MTNNITFHDPASGKTRTILIGGANPQAVLCYINWSVLNRVVTALHVV